MEGKVLLYDSNNVKIGETFARRARQLVKQQRASWVDDSQNAIRFAPGMDGDDMPTHDMQPTDEADKKLMKFAKEKVHAQFALKIHRNVSFIIMGFLFLIYSLTGGSYFWPIWPMLGLGLSVVIHWMIYKAVFGENMQEKIALEYERLKYGRD